MNLTIEQIAQQKKTIKMIKCRPVGCESASGNS